MVKRKQERAIAIKYGQQLLLLLYSVESSLTSVSTQEGTKKSLWIYEKRYWPANEEIKRRKSKTQVPGEDKSWKIIEEMTILSARWWWFNPCYHSDNHWSTTICQPFWWAQPQGDRIFLVTQSSRMDSGRFLDTPTRDFLSGVAFLANIIRPEDGRISQDHKTDIT